MSEPTTPNPDDAHFYARVAEHYDAPLQPGEFAAMKRVIRNGYSRRVDGRADGSVIHAVRVPGRPEQFLVAVRGRTLITALPRNAYIEIEGRWVRARQPTIKGSRNRLDGTPIRDGVS